MSSYLNEFSLWLINKEKEASFMKKKMDALKKVKLIYSGEIFLFAILFLVLGILFLVKVIDIQDYKKWLFPILTMVGATWNIAELIWALVSKKKRAKTSLLDKYLMVPASLVFLVFGSFALITLIINPSTTSLDVFFPVYIGATLLYSSAIYFFQSIYHYFYPVPALLAVIQEENDAQLEEGKIELSNNNIESEISEKKDE